MKLAIQTLAALFILTSFVPASLAGIVLIDRNGGETLISGNSTRSPDISGSGLYTIYDGRAGILTYVNTRAFTYSTGTAEEYCAAAGSGGPMGIEEDMLQYMPEEMRAQLKESMMMPGDGPGAFGPIVMVAYGGAGGTIAGYETSRFEVLADGRLFEEVWITQDPSLMSELSGFSTTGMEYFSCDDERSRGVIGSREYKDLMSRGLVLRVVAQADAMHKGALLDVVKVLRLAISGSELRPPLGFMRISPAEMMNDIRRQYDLH